MATHYTVPTYFTAEGGQYAETLNRLKQKNREFAMGTKAIGRQVASYLTVGSAFTAGGLLARESFNEAKNYEEAVDSFHTIVSELNDVQFKPFQDKIDQVAKDTRRSGTEVAQSFEKIAGINAKFAETANGLGMVSKAAITLGKAAKMDLGASAESLVGIMNQFSFAADQADRTINALAAGQAVGAASISETAEAFTIFGAEAARTNTSIEKSIGLVQTLAKFNLRGSEAGTKIRGVINRLQRAGLGYASGQFVINDALKQTNTILQKLKTNKEKDLFLNGLLGIENGTAGRLLLQNVGLYEEFTRAVTGTNEAYKAAAINTSNLATSVRELGASWSRVITGSKTGKELTNQLSGAIKWLAENMEDVVYWAAELAKGYLFWKATTASVYLLNGAIGVYNALFTRSVVLTYANSTAQAAYITTSKIGATVLGVLNGELSVMNALMAVNPAALVVGSIAALTAGIYLLDKAQRKYNETQKAAYAANINKERILNLKEEEVRLSELIKKYMSLGHTIEQSRFLAVKGNIEMLRNEAFVGEQGIKKTESELKAERDKLYFADILAGTFGYKSDNTGKRGELSNQLLEQKKALRPTYEQLGYQMLYAKDLYQRGGINKSDMMSIFPSKSTSSNKPNASLPWGEQQASVNDKVMKESMLREYYLKGDKPTDSNIKITIVNSSTGEAIVEDNSSLLFKVKPSSTETTKLNGR